MADPSRQHIQSLYDLVRAGLPETVDVYIANVDKADDDITYPYVVMWPPPPRRHIESLAGYGGSLSTRTQITGAGTTVDEVLAVLDRAAEALHGVVPTIVGRSCGRIEVSEDEQPPPILVDPTHKTAQGRSIYTGVLFVHLYSTVA